MGRLLERYILREMIASGFAVTLVLVLILLTNEGARVLSRAADNQYPHDVVFALIGLGAVQHLPIFVAVGLLLGMVMAFGRLYHDSEMTAALAKLKRIAHAGANTVRTDHEIRRQSRTIRQDQHSFAGRAGRR